MILLLALALARPSIVASGVLGDQEAPVAAALVFDTNPRMQYRQNNETRLEVAQQTADWLLPQLPAESDVAVVDSRSGTAVFAVDIGAARQRIERLEADTMSQPLSLAIESAVELVSESDKPRKEIYVFTDLSQAAWSKEAMNEAMRRLAEHTGIGIYLIDVGVADPINFGLGDTTLSAEVLSRNSPLYIQSDVLHAGPAAETAVELYVVDRETGAAEVRGRRAIEAAAGGGQRAAFQLRGLSTGVHQGYLKLVGEDALACDDRHWFTVEVRPAWRVLLAAPSDGVRKPDDYGLFFSEALAPYAMRVKGEAAFECDVVNLAELNSKNLDAYNAVCLIDPGPIEPATWQKLHGFVAAGGGLGIFLGRNATPIDSFNEPAGPGPAARQAHAAMAVRRRAVPGARRLSASGVGQVSRAGHCLAAVADLSALAARRAGRRGHDGHCIFQQPGCARRPARGTRPGPHVDHADFRRGQPPGPPRLCAVELVANR